MHLDFLESAEFYNRRYHNFSSRVIFPMSLLVVFTFGFAMFAEKEISLSSKATVEPSRIIANIQSTSNRRMVVNYLEENKQVQRGDLLVQYQEVGDVIQYEANANQLESFRHHQSKTSNLKNSTTQPNIGLFSQNSSTVQEQIAVEQDDLEREIGKKNQTSLLEKGTIRAQEDGVLYLNPERNQSAVVTEGTLLAKLYPLLDREGKTKLTAYLSSKDIVGIKIGDSVRFTTTNGANGQVRLVSTITSIDTIATRTDQGNFFKIEAETKITQEQAEKLRYGLEGHLQIITGKKSYLRYYLDDFLNWE
ncbi:HlyD family efflux transporter periplasmic adaptor subunit [Streptococcus infantis]|uniref:HlyD family efflux transporter periplasmic adaptor subunit n=1 Tax=Streptococcus infantis TaxID=68892 RepID=UPI001CBCB76E|nr:HlyD family efflux transporter periplasmic adaptor subunit [Streptococcus infantis]MBZ2120732.1 HlyD family efflux transporter periplasmic adaptor subunit [Streptococcus infantis]MBZ2122528.1 HlyD family efflux transporter periplasmic adaptor subunit [Streptococcus infantis]MBZ2126302.1 HlyD family efflux transporter periplasmic adaptor subunit [Streptococcus infantis]